MYAAGASPRRRSAYAARMEAKRQRQKWIIIGLGVVLAIIVAYEIPHTFHLTGGKTESTAPTTPAPAPPPAPRAIPRSLHSSSDPFVKATLVDSDPQMQGETGGHDPFARPGAAAAAPTTQVSSAALPKQIVLGTPGGGRQAHRGWIVILASIPTGEGRDAAVRFASHASGVGSLQILNSSNRRPLRGGYWVVYTGPYDTLAQVSQQADSVHAAGYPDAYLRELIVYR